MVCHFKVKLWAFFWGQGEHEWPLVDGKYNSHVILYLYNKCEIIGLVIGKNLFQYITTFYSICLVIKTYNKYYY